MQLIYSVSPGKRKSSHAHSFSPIRYKEKEVESTWSALSVLLQSQTQRPKSAQIRSSPDQLKLLSSFATNKANSEILPELKPTTNSLIAIDLLKQNKEEHSKYLSPGQSLPEDAPRDPASFVGDANF